MEFLPVLGYLALLIVLAYAMFWIPEAVFAYTLQLFFWIIWNWKKGQCQHCQDMTMHSNKRILHPRCRRDQLCCQACTKKHWIEAALASKVPSCCGSPMVVAVVCNEIAHRCGQCGRGAFDESTLHRILGDHYWRGHRDGEKIAELNAMLSGWVVPIK